jgi:hypothetical protein
MAADERAPHGYVRIAEADLPTLRIQHLTTAIDMSIALPDALAGASGAVTTGYTEWTGAWHDATVSLGWDWGFHRNTVLMLHPTEVRTNIQLIAADGLPRSPVLCRIRLAQWLDSVPWREVVHEVLEAEGHGQG